MFYRVLEIRGLECFLMKVSQRAGRRPLGFIAKFWKALWIDQVRTTQLPLSKLNS